MEQRTASDCSLTECGNGVKYRWITRIVRMRRCQRSDTVLGRPAELLINAVSTVRPGEPEVVREALDNKGVDVDLDRILDVDEGGGS